MRRALREGMNAEHVYKVMSAKGDNCGCVIREATEQEIAAFHVNNRLNRDMRIGDVIVSRRPSEAYRAHLDGLMAASPEWMRPPCGALWW